MKINILKKNKGFTLVECVVAMAIFAILSLIVFMLLQSSISIYGENYTIDNTVENQVIYILKDEKKYDESNSADGNIKLDFGDSAVIDAEMQKNGGKPNEDFPLNYFVADVGELNNEDDDSDDDGEDGIPLQANSVLYGSKGIDKVEFTITSLGSGKYRMVVKIIDSGVPESQKYYRQFKINFKDASHIKNFKVITTGEYEKYKYFVKQINSTTVDISNSENWEGGGINGCKVAFEFESDVEINYDYFGSNIGGVYPEKADNPGIYG